MTTKPEDPGGQVNKTSIEWTATPRPDGTLEPGFTANPLKYRDAAGNVVWGCVKTSPGCAHCYAETLAKRYGRGGPFAKDVMRGLTPFLDEKELRRMLTYKPAAGKRCFVGDMTDLFGEWVPDALLDQLFAVLALRPDVTWQVLTKRAERMQDYCSKMDRSRLDDSCGQFVDGCRFHGDLPAWPLPNVHLGVSAEDQQRANERIPHLLRTPAAVRFLSCEPLLGPVSLPWHCNKACPGDPSACQVSEGGCLCAGLHWCIIGGESGTGARPCDVAWVRSVVQQCREVEVPAFVKQLGTRPVMDYYEGNPDLREWGLEHERLVLVPCRGGYAEHGPRDGQPPPGALLELRLPDPKGGSPEEWPPDLRVREFPVPHKETHHAD